MDFFFLLILEVFTAVRCTIYIYVECWWKCSLAKMITQGGVGFTAADPLYIFVDCKCMHGIQSYCTTYMSE